MHVFDIQSEYQNHALILGLGRNLFHILHNIPTVVGITIRGNGYEWIIYDQLIWTNIHIDIKDICNQCGWYKR